MALSRFVWVRLFCSTPSGSYCFVITNPALHAGLLKFDYFVVLELRSCSMLIAMYEMHGQLIIISVTTPPSLCFQKSKVVAGLNLKYFGSTTQTVTEP